MEKGKCAAKKNENVRHNKTTAATKKGNNRVFLP